MTAWHLSVRVGGYQNPGVCLQAFPSFPTPPPSPPINRPIYRPEILCSRTAQKRLLRRLGNYGYLKFYENGNKTVKYLELFW